jgi:hypothetical protein
MRRYYSSVRKEVVSGEEAVRQSMRSVPALPGIEDGKAGTLRILCRTLVADFGLLLLLP